MSSSSPETIVSWLEEYPLVLDHYAYGTAGFRYQAETLEGLFLRVGLCMALLVKEENMGLMVTASHNDESYNGIKVSQADGSMLNAKDEAVLVEWCNQRDFQQWRQILIIIANNYRQKSPSGVLHIGRDTRSHSERLAKLAIEGAQAMGITVVNHGLMTTPMLHHVVLHSNTNYVPPNLVPAPTRKGYIQQLANAYCALVLALAQHSSSSSCKPLQIDCACGIGYDAVKELNAAVAQKLDTDRFMAHNAPDDGPLNTSCGSEHVQKQLQAPIFYRGQVNDGSYCCSLDGDADRIVFFAHTPSTGLTLLDGDKISVLIAHVLQPLLRKRKAPIQLGVVQTAYANGASTQYLKETLQIPVVITKTGVKHLHHAALEFDIGIYFEANGHGTVLFGPNYYKWMDTLLETEDKLWFQTLSQLINPAVGDALSDLLLVDLLLQKLQWNLQDWNTLYQDWPSRQLKVKVQDRSLVQCNANETKCIAPSSLQPALEQLMASTEKGRCFVRASGTENVVRVYAEAASRPLADQLATQTAQLVHRHCGGVGPLSAI